MCPDGGGVGGCRDLVRLFSNEPYREFRETRPAEVVANIAICLIHQANYLLDQQLRRLEQDFLKEGGLRERMTRVRLQARDERRKGEWSGRENGRDSGRREKSVSERR